MPNFTNDSNNIARLNTPPTGDAGQAVDGNFGVISALITAISAAIATLQSSGDPTALKIAHNLSDVANAATARSNLGLGSAATANTSAFDAAGTTSTHAALTTTHGVSGNIVGTSDTQTLTNKTINGSNNTLSNINVSSLTGTLGIGSGGTGQTTAAAALTALLPSQTSNSGKALTTNGTSASWTTVSGGGGSPGGAAGDVQYNDGSGGFAGDDQVQMNGGGNVTAATFSATSGFSLPNAPATGCIMFTGISNSFITPETSVRTDGAGNWEGFHSLEIQSTGTANGVLLTVDNSTSNYTLTLPLTAGSSGQFLTTNGSGVCTWTTSASFDQSLNTTDSPTFVTVNATTVTTSNLSSNSGSVLVNSPVSFRGTGTTLDMAGNNIAMSLGNTTGGGNLNMSGGDIDNVATLNATTLNGNGSNITGLTASQLNSGAGISTTLNWLDGDGSTSHSLTILNGIITAAT